MSAFVTGWTDIGYSYLIGDDGNAYEGRGWEWVGSHTCCGNCNSRVSFTKICYQKYTKCFIP